VSDVWENLAGILHRATIRLREAGLPAEVTGRMETLAGQAHEPCVVAVVGRVKVGKSTFVNALLGEDLAKVGTTETTAPINYFAYGQPDPEPRAPPLARREGHRREQGFFGRGLQRNDLETLRRADWVDHLEYFLPNPVLKQITLVDTPGTGAVVTLPR
jgi:GTPase SAR1 family protein